MDDKAAETIHDCPVMGTEGFAGRIRLQNSRCAIEPIHTPGSIQPHGILLVADMARDLVLISASANAERLVPLGSDVLAYTLPQLLGDALHAELQDAMAAGGLRPGMPLETMISLDGVTYDVSSHAHDGLLLIELTPTDPNDALTALRASQHLVNAVAELRGSEGDLNDLGFAIVRSIRRLTGYERVLVYKFDQDWNGQAIAEDMVPGFPEPLLGLHFPESDIPSQARALYRLSLMRWTLSRDAETVGLRALADWARPIDLSYARLRSLSPVHMQYHRNLGVDGAMSISVMDGARLWGLVVCHHRLPHRTTMAQRAAALALTDAFALRIRPAELAGAEAARQSEQVRYSALISQLADCPELEPALTAGPVTVLDLFDVPGAAVVRGDQIARLGNTPPAEGIASLASWLRSTAPAGDVFATSSLIAILPDWTHLDTAGGVLAIFLDPARTDMLLWFRPEEPHLVSWGGDPVKEPNKDGIVLPRQSFARWVEERRGTAAPWAAHEIEIATLLRHALTDVILRNLRQVATLSEQLRQSQKMEAVGQLTGGLAHDFNNLLAGITSSLELAQRRIEQGRTVDLGRYLGAASEAATRAAALTHRLLAFSRRQTLDPKPVDANRLIASMEDLIRRTMGPEIQVEVVRAPGLWTILCDANQLENALLNLALNARDAMAGGGRLTIEAANIRLDDFIAAGYELPPGHYVGMSVSDTGHGMPPDVVARVFEPFFTTKPLGKGTGLGLSMVYGFTRQSGGQTRIYTEPGQGTTIRMVLPRYVGELAEEAVAAPTGSMDLSGAHVVLVDDEPVLRAMVTEALTDAGCRVTGAADAREALALLGRAGPIHLLVTDIGLPGGINGRQLAEAVRERHPGLKVLFVTGYAETAALAGGLLGRDTQVMTKPFNLQSLILKVRSMTETSR